MTDKMKFIPSKFLNAPNDKLTKIIFSLTSDEFQTLLQGDVFTLRETKNENHAKIIRSPFWMKFDTQFFLLAFPNFPQDITQLL